MDEFATASVIAHRGAPKEAVENTAEAFACALEYPIAGIECDVQITRDAVPVLFHDFTLERLAGDSRRISDLSWDELDSLRLANGERILSLEGLLRDFGGSTTFLFEIKVDPQLEPELRRQLARVTAELLHRYSSTDFQILSFDLSVLEELHALHPTWPLAWNLEGKIDLKLIEDVSHRWLTTWSFHHEALTPELAVAAKKYGQRLMVWTCDDAAAVDRALHCGAEAIISNRPDWLCEYLPQKVNS